MTKRKRVRRNPLEEAQQLGGVSGEEGVVAQVGRSRGEEEPAMERIERLQPSQMIPDRFQPRRLLPSKVRRRFFAGEIDCYQAARAWLQLAEEDTGWKAQIDDLLAMGDSFQEHGQIKPITGTWITDPERGFLFQIETGERRFWAACLQRVQEKQEQEPGLRVEIVEQHTRHRQVLENRHAQSPSAVGQACEVAGLLLERLGKEPDPGLTEEYEYFKAAVEMRAPRGFWLDTEPIMRLSTRRMQQLLALLQFPSTLLEFADRHRIPERVLREVIQLDQEQWVKTLEDIVRQGLTAEDVSSSDDQEEKNAKKPRRRDGRRTPDKIAMSGLRRFSRAAFNLPSEKALDLMLNEVADEIVVAGLAEELTPVLSELVKRIQARISRS